MCGVNDNRAGRTKSDAWQSAVGKLGKWVLIPALAGLLFGHSPVEAMENDEAAIHCLALNIYFEARGEPELGKHAVGHVVMNRVSDAKFPDRI